MQEQSFNQWCILELFGHVRLAGLVSEQTIAGAAFIRIDVPETENTPAFTRIFGASAIYAINPVTEEFARSVVAQMAPTPVTMWDIREYNNKQLPQNFPHNNC